MLFAGTALATLPALLPAVLTAGADVALAGCTGASYPLPYTEYKGTNNADTIVCSNTYLVPIKAKDGDDTLTLSGTVGDARGGNGNDTFNVGSGAMGVLDGGNDNDTFNISGGALADLEGGSGDDTFNISGGATALLQGGSGKDTVNLSGGLVTYMDTGADDDTINLDGGLFGGVSAGDGADTITLNGSGANVAGAVIDAGDGDDTIDLKGGVFGVVLGGDGEDTITLSGASSYDAGAYINSGDGNDSFTWSDGSLLLFQGGAGDDTALVTTSNFTDLPTLDGGAGSGDALTFDGISFSVVNLTLTNWETITVSDGVMTVDPLLLPSVALNLSEEDGNGLIIESDAGLVVNDLLSLTGDLTNAGYIDLMDGATDDEIDISDDYVGGGDLEIDVDFTNNLADMLDIGGDLTGTTVVSVGDLSGAVITGEDVLVASVDGTNSGALVLASDVFAGAFQYDFDTLGNDWYLVSSFSPAAPIYDAYGQSLLTMSRMSSMQERMGDRRVGELGTGLAFWGRTSGSYGEFAPTSATEAAFSQTIWDVETGVDGVLDQFEDGKVIAGFSLRYSDGRSDVTSPTGEGTIDSRAGIAGLYLTALQDDGSYADVQVQAGYFNSDLSSGVWGDLASDLDAWTASASVEIGKRIALANGWSITPQSQVSGVTVRMDGFTGPIGETVSFDDATGVTWRNGVSVDWSRSDANGVSSLHGVANLVYTLAGDSMVTVSGYDIVSTSTDGLSGEIGIGGTHSWNGGRFALTGQVTASTGLSGPAEDYRVGATLGFAARW